MRNFSRVFRTRENIGILTSARKKWYIGINIKYNFKSSNFEKTIELSSNIVDVGEILQSRIPVVNLVE